MDSEILISIIIPMYNPEIDELERCLDSISAIRKNIEVILIDDGSYQIDGLRLCNAYIQKDKRFKYYHQKNKGVSAARNLGLSKVKGEYVCFVDIDDMVNSEALNNLSTQIIRNSELVLFDVLEVLKSGDEKKREIFNTPSGFQYKKEIVKCFVLTSKLSECWGKLYKTEVINRYHILFPIGVDQGEDSIFNCLYFRNISGAYYVKDIFYQYYYTCDNTYLRFINNPIERLNDVLTNYKFIISLLEKTFQGNELTSYIEQIDSMYTDGFGSRILLLTKHNLVNQGVKDFINKEVGPLILKDTRNILKKKPRACAYDLIFRNNLWFAFKILGCFKRISIW